MKTSSIILIIAILIAFSLGSILLATWRDNLRLGLEVRTNTITISDFEKDKIALDQLLAGLNKDLRKYKEKDRIWRLFYGEVGWQRLLRLMEGAK